MILLVSTFLIVDAVPDNCGVAEFVAYVLNVYKESGNNPDIIYDCDALAGGLFKFDEDEWFMSVPSL